MPARVAIIMPVCNAARHVTEALQSVFAQTHAGIDLIVIDDGSTDDSPRCIKAAMADAPARIQARVLHQDNQGSVGALNRGIEEALQTAAGFIAIMHADDIALPHRIGRQVDYLQAHPAIDICGTWIETFGGPAPRTWQYPTEPRFTKPALLFRCCFAHPTMMFRRHVLEGTSTMPPLRYDPAFPMPCEDYALWARASQNFHMGNIGEILLRYREHAAQGGAIHRQKTAALTAAIRRGLIGRLGISPAAQEMMLHQQLAESELQPTQEFVRASRDWLERLAQANQRAAMYDHDALQKILAGRWAATCLHAAAADRADAAWIWREFWQCPLAAFVDRTLEKNQSIPSSNP